jgi:hypothetical protein
MGSRYMPGCIASHVLYLRFHRIIHAAQIIFIRPFFFCAISFSVFGVHLSARLNRLRLLDIGSLRLMISVMELAGGVCIWVGDTASQRLLSSLHEPSTAGVHSHFGGMQEIPASRAGRHGGMRSARQDLICSRPALGQIGVYVSVVISAVFEGLAQDLQMW